jgi:predicted GNAT superfamily acetyltransferase
MAAKLGLAQRGGKGAPRDLHSGLSVSQSHHGADGIAIRLVATLEEYAACVALQELIWGPGFKETVPPAILMVAQKMAGVTAGAFDASGRLLGFVFGISGLRHGRLSHWSDMLAVHPDARGANLGERLKHFQREVCRSHGIPLMYWTFDPLVARNAHLNLMRLGARAAEYAVNLYGSNTGSPLHGALDTDRWIAAWDLETPVVPPVAPVDHGVFVLRADASAALPIESPLVDAPAVRIGIPDDHERLSFEERVAWRLATRHAFTHYLGAGWTVRGFFRRAGETPAFYELLPST